MADIIEEPIALHLVVRESLNMNAGEIARQVGHAVEKVIVQYFKAQIVKAKTHSELPTDDLRHIQLTTDWLGHGSRKIVLKCDEENWETLKNEYGRNCMVVKNAGLTELEPNTDTVLVLWPEYNSKVSDTIKKLSPLR